MCQFLARYYWWFIPHFVSIATPLMGLLTKDSLRQVRWSDKCEEAFWTLKKSLCSKPVLFSPDFKQEFIVQTDVSGVGLGTVLSQEVEGREHPIGYLSRKLFPREKNYSVTEKEALAVK